MRKFALLAARFAVAAIAALYTTVAAQAQQGDALREAAQNPIADLISLPFQNNTNFDIGRSDNTENILNIQPVIPLHLNRDWNLITRSILPVIYQPPFLAGPELRALEEIAGPGVGATEFGLGDFNPAFAFSPSKAIALAPGVALYWGAGPIFQLPTATSDQLGTGKWSAGPTFVAVLVSKKIVTGFLVNNLWSFAGDQDRAEVDAMTLQPFFNLNLPEGWYLTTSPIITANWEADSANRWTLPVGFGIGRVFKIGRQPVNAQISGYYNVLTPNDTGANWQLRTQFTFLFPEH